MKIVHEHPSKEHELFMHVQYEIVNMNIHEYSWIIVF